MCWESLTTYMKALLESSKTIERPNFSIDKPYTPADAMSATEGVASTQGTQYTVSAI